MRVRPRASPVLSAVPAIGDHFKGPYFVVLVGNCDVRLPADDSGVHALKRLSVSRGRLRFRGAHHEHGHAESPLPRVAVLFAPASAAPESPAGPPPASAAELEAGLRLRVQEEERAAAASAAPSRRPLFAPPASADALQAAGMGVAGAGRGERYLERIVALLGGVERNTGRPARAAAAVAG